MYIKRFNETKRSKKSKDDVEIGFDVDSLVDKEVDDKEGFVSKAPFVSDLEEMPKNAEKKLKKEIQGITPGLKKSIKKFEEISIEIEIDTDDDSENDDFENTGCGCCPNCTGEVDCNCGCVDCNCDSQIQTNDEISTFSDYVGLSEKMKYHLYNKISVVENVFRPGSESFISLIKEARQLNDSGAVRFSGQDRYLFENTDLGRFAKFRGEMVPLDLPLEIIEEINEAEYKGKEVELNHPMRGGTKKYHVYVKNPKTGKVKKIAFGDVHGGLTAKVSNPKARKAFAARHNCKDKKDKTKAGYWACRLNRFGHLHAGNKTYPGFW